jgi:hypothetical protein
MDLCENFSIERIEGLAGPTPDNRDSPSPAWIGLPAA